MQRIFDESNSYADVLRKLNMNEHGSNRKTLLKVIDEYSLDLTQINKNRSDYLNKKLDNRQCIPLEKILNGEVEYKGSSLKNRLIKEGYKAYQCEKCGITEWNEQPAPLQLHHKDGNHHNNELDNLEILCANCHAQTDNYAGKNVKYETKTKPDNSCRKAKIGISEDGTRLYDGYGNYKVLCPVCNTEFMNRDATMCRKCYETQRRIPKVSKEELLDILKNHSYRETAKLLGYDHETISRWHRYYCNEEKESGNYIICSDAAPNREELKQKIRTQTFISIGKEYERSDNAVRKWCDAYSLPRRTKDIHNISDEDWELI